MELLISWRTLTELPTKLRKNMAVAGAVFMGDPDA